MKRFFRDIDFAHRRRWPGRHLNLPSCAWLLASSPGLRLLMLHRINHWLYSKRANDGKAAWRWRVLSLLLAPLRWAIKIDSRSDLDELMEMAGGVCFSDVGQIIYETQSTGEGTVIGPRVTVGMRLTDPEHPVIGRNVWIGPDCVVYGPIRIGDGATLLPGTVLTKSIAAGAVMQGNPARMVLQGFDNTGLRMNRNADAMALVIAQRGG